MSWYSDPWTQDDSVLGGLPYTVAPPEPYSIEGVKLVWNWSPRVLGGLPYTVWMPPENAGVYVNLPSGELSIKAFTKAIIDKKTITFSVSGRIGTTFEIK